MEPAAARVKRHSTSSALLTLRLWPFRTRPHDAWALRSDLLELDSQAALLEHYLDVVFPNQFPFYNPPASEGGRSWLVLIMMRTKPLYHAALSMAAYHQKPRDCEFFELQALTFTFRDKLLSHHSLAIKELRNHLDTFEKAVCAQSLEGNIEVLACIVFLTSLEVRHPFPPPPF